MSSRKDNRDRGNDPVPQIQKSFMPKGDPAPSIKSKPPNQTSSHRNEAPGGASSQPYGVLVQRDGHPLLSTGNTNSSILGTKLERDYPKPKREPASDSSRKTSAGLLGTTLQRDGPRKIVSQSPVQTSRQPSKDHGPNTAPKPPSVIDRQPATHSAHSPARSYLSIRKSTAPSSGPGVRAQGSRVGVEQTRAEDDRARAGDRTKAVEAEEALKRTERRKARVEDDQKEQSHGEDDSTRQRGEETREHGMDSERARIGEPEDSQVRTGERDRQHLESPREIEGARFNEQYSREFRQLIGIMALSDPGSQQEDQLPAYSQNNMASESNVTINDDHSRDHLYEAVGNACLAILQNNQGDVQYGNSRANDTTGGNTHITGEQHGSGLFSLRQQIQQASFTPQQGHRMAIRHVHYDTMSVEERRQQDMWIQWRLNLCGACPMGFGWRRDGFGFRCSAGDHYVTDQMLILGTTGCMICVNGIDADRTGETEIFVGPVADDREARAAMQDWTLVKRGLISMNLYGSKWPDTYYMNYD